MRGFIGIESLMFADMQLRCIRIFAHAPGFADPESLTFASRRLLQQFGFVQTPVAVLC